MNNLSSVLKTSSSLVLVLGIALACGLVSFHLGADSLKGISQIDLKPPKGSKAAKTGEEVSFDNNIPFLKETDLIKDIKTKIRGDIKSGKIKPEKMK